jgi:DNA-directed RNA polymerase subunit RPC12/RpoP
MEALDSKVEFLCLGCGLQGLLGWSELDVENIICPKCGDRLITSHLLKKKDEYELVTL